MCGFRLVARVTGFMVTGVPPRGQFHGISNPNPLVVSFMEVELPLVLIDVLESNDSCDLCVMNSRSRDIQINEYNLLVYSVL